MALQDVIKYLITTVGAVDGIRKKTDYPPEALNAYPQLLAYAQTGTYEIGPAGVMKGLHSLVVEIHVARMDLERDLKKLMAFADTVPVAIMKDPTLGGTVSTISTVRYDLVNTEYNGQQTLLFRWTLENVKIQTVL